MWCLGNRAEVALGARWGAVFSGARVKKGAFLAEIGRKGPFLFSF